MNNNEQKDDLIEYADFLMQPQETHAPTETQLQKTFNIQQSRTPSGCKFLHK